MERLKKQEIMDVGVKEMKTQSLKLSQYLKAKLEMVRLGI
jgi:hypothetical protein